MRGKMRQKMDKKTDLSWLTIILHWGIALLVLVLFFLGIWMVDLNYYDPWYYDGPWWHKGFGVVLFGLLIWQGCWQFYRVKVVQLLAPGSWQARLSVLMHFLLLFMTYLIILTGYFMVTGLGQGVIVFDWFSLPALMLLGDNVMQLFGDFHCYGAYFLMGLVSLHILAALKHHFFDKDSVLIRMLGKRGS